MNGRIYYGTMFRRQLFDHSTFEILKSISFLIRKWLRMKKNFILCAFYVRQFFPREYKTEKFDFGIGFTSCILSLLMTTFNGFEPFFMNKNTCESVIYLISIPLANFHTHIQTPFLPQFLSSKWASETTAPPLALPLLAHDRCVSVRWDALPPSFLTILFAYAPSPVRRRKE